LALIEGGSTNFSAIHARLHHSARKELEILHRLNATYINDQETVEELGELVVYREDFTGPMDVLPVSDPNIFSEAQRYAQLQAVMQLESMPQFAQYFKPERLLIRALRLLQVPYAEDIANLPKDPQRLDPVDENAAAALDDGTPLKVYEEQDDYDHMMSHITFMTSPLLGGTPVVGAVAVPKLLAHCKEHMVAYYRKHHKAAADALKMMSKMPGGLKMSDSQAQARGHAFADKAMAEALAPMIAPGLADAANLAQQYAPKPPADGNTQATLAAQQSIEQMRLQQASKDKADALAHAKDLKQMELQFNKEQREADRDQQDQAAQVTALIEKMQSENEKSIAMLTLHMENKHEEAREANKVTLQEMKSQSDAIMLVLQSLLTQTAPPAEGEGAAEPEAKPEPVNMQAIIAPLIQGMQDNNAQLAAQFASHTEATGVIMGQVAQSLQALHAAGNAPRVHQLVKDKLGNTTGLRSVIDTGEQK
jgi:hypothetical protein